MKEYNESHELKNQDDEWENDLSLEEFLNEMDRGNDFMDSDVEGMIKN